MRGVENIVLHKMKRTEKVRKYQKLYEEPFCSYICHWMTNNMALIMAPTKIKGRRRPHLEVVLSETKPIIGSEIASKNRGMAESKPAIAGSIPKAVIKKKENTPKAPGRRLLTK
jgi:hypothetical protein